MVVTPPVLLFQTGQTHFFFFFFFNAEFVRVCVLPDDIQCKEHTRTWPYTVIAKHVGVLKF